MGMTRWRGRWVVSSGLVAYCMVVRIYDMHIVSVCELAFVDAKNTLVWEIYLAPVQVQRLMICGRSSQFDPATDKICKQQIK